MTCYKKGDKVLYESPVSGDRTPAIFVSHDMGGWPRADCILAHKIGSEPHTFRWPLAYVEHYTKERVRNTTKERKMKPERKHKKRR